MQLIRDPKDFPVGRTIFYAFAMPDHEYYRNYCDSVFEWTRQQLALHWIWVPIDGTTSQNYPIDIKIKCSPGCTCGFSQQLHIESSSEPESKKRKRKHAQL
jgi:hypothetical protein